jgi:hypothetical protein
MGRVAHRYALRTCSRMPPWALFITHITCVKITHGYAVINLPDAFRASPMGTLYYAHFMCKAYPWVCSYNLLDVFRASPMGTFYYAHYMCKGYPWVCSHKSSGCVPGVPPWAPFITHITCVELTHGYAVIRPLDVPHGHSLLHTLHV